MIVLCDTCAVLMLIRIAPEMFTDPAFDVITIPGVMSEFIRTQKFKTKYPWRSDYKDKVVPKSKSYFNDEEYHLYLSAINSLLDSGVLNERIDKLFDLSRVDREVTAYALSANCKISTGDQGIIDFASQEFSEDFQGNISPLEVINSWLSKGVIEWNEAKHRILEEWSLTEERPQPSKAKSRFKKITGKKYPGP